MRAKIGALLAVFLFLLVVPTNAKAEETNVISLRPYSNLDAKLKDDDPATYVYMPYLGSLRIEFDKPYDLKAIKVRADTRVWVMTLNIYSQENGSRGFVNGDNTYTPWPRNATKVVYLQASDMSMNFYDVDIFGEVGLPPLAPTSLKATATNGRVDLTWDGPSNATTYNIYQNGSKVGTSSTKTYTVTGVQSNVEHSWQVSALNDYGESDRSAPVKTYWDTIPPAKPTNLMATAKPNQVYLEWLANHDDTTGYFVYRDGVRVNATPVNATSYALTEDPSVSHQYTVSAVDAAGNESAQSDPVTGQALDRTPPAAPTGLKAEGKEGSVLLTWKANTEPDLNGYLIYRNGSRLNLEPYNGTSFSVTGGTFGTVYTFQVSAVDKVGNESAKSAPSSAAPIKPPDTTPPATPTGLTGSLSSDGLKILLSWHNNTEADLAGYNVYVSKNGISFEKVNAAILDANTYAFSADGNQQYYFKISAVDAAGNESPPTPAMPFKTPSRVPVPDVEKTPPKLIITWAPITGAVQYLIYYQDQLKAIVGSTVTQYEIPLADGYDPEAERQKVVVKARFLDGTIGTDAPDAAEAAAKNWGFGPRDIVSNSAFLITSLAGFVLLGLVVRIAPKLLKIIREAVRRRRGYNT
jgi:hypothetical protein